MVGVGFTLYQEEKEAITVSWCSWLSRQSNTLKVSGSNPGDAIFLFFFFFYYLTLKLINIRLY